VLALVCVFYCSGAAEGASAAVRHRQPMLTEHGMHSDVSSEHASYGVAQDSACVATQAALCCFYSSICKHNVHVQQVVDVSWSETVRDVMSVTAVVVC
jgi:hypothetical protein